MFLNNLQVSGLTHTDDDLWQSSVTGINWLWFRLKDFNPANKLSVVPTWNVTTVAGEQTVPFLNFFTK